jgi:BolA protein
MIAGVAGKRGTWERLRQGAFQMTMKERITEKLTRGLAPLYLDVLDESQNHFGHAGWREGGETHFRVKVVSARFAGLGRLQRHRLVNDLLADELRERVHALAIEARAPGETG